MQFNSLSEFSGYLTNSLSIIKENSGNIEEALNSIRIGSELNPEYFIEWGRVLLNFGLNDNADIINVFCQCICLWSSNDFYGRQSAFLQLIHDIGKMDNLVVIYDRLYNMYFDLFKELKDNGSPVNPNIIVTILSPVIKDMFIPDEKNKYFEILVNLLYQRKDDIMVSLNDQIVFFKLLYHACFINAMLPINSTNEYKLVEPNEQIKALFGSIKNKVVELATIMDSEF